MHAATELWQEKKKLQPHECDRTASTLGAERIESMDERIEVNVENLLAAFHQSTVG